MELWLKTKLTKNTSQQQELCALKQRNFISPLAQFKLQKKRGKKQDDNGQCCQGLGATQLPITLMEVLHPVMLLLAPFMQNIMSLSAWPLRQNEGERGVQLAAKWSREMRIPSGWQTPRRLSEKVSFALIWLFFEANNITFYLVHLHIFYSLPFSEMGYAFAGNTCIFFRHIYIKLFQSHNSQLKKWKLWAQMLI